MIIAWITIPSEWPTWVDLHFPLVKKRQLLSFIYFVPSVQHRTLLLRPPESVVRLHLVSHGLCARQQSACMGGWPFRVRLSDLHVGSAPVLGNSAKLSLPDLPGLVHHPFVGGQWSQCIGNTCRGVFSCRTWCWGERQHCPQSHMEEEQPVLCWGTDPGYGHHTSL